MRRKLYRSGHASKGGPLLRKLREWFRPTPKNAEELAARQEADALRRQMETQRTGSLDGSGQFTHGGKESR
jgi:hypothetical protein